MYGCSPKISERRSMNSSNQESPMIARNPTLCTRNTVEIGTCFCTMTGLAYRVPSGQSLKGCERLEGKRLGFQRNLACFRAGDGALTKDGWHDSGGDQTPVTITLVYKQDNSRH